MRWLSYRYLKLRGWTFVGSVPDVPKMIIIGAPHTSNFDFVLFLGTIFHHGLNVRFLGKSQLFRRPFGWLFRMLGGIPVDRARAGEVVGQTKTAFESAKEMILVIAPEGTRSAAGQWKSGFIKIADVANVPVLLAGVDGPNKRITFGPALSVNSDDQVFMDEVRSFYETQPGLKPDRKGPVKLKGESLVS